MCVHVHMEPKQVFCIQQAQGYTCNVHITVVLLVTSILYISLTIMSFLSSPNMSPL